MCRREAPTTNDMQDLIHHIQKLTEAEAKLILLFAMQDLRKAIYNPSPTSDATTLGWLTQKIEILAQENAQP